MGYKILTLLIGILIFLTGFLASYAYNSIYIDVEKPYFIGLKNTDSQPSNWINEKNIEVYPDKIIINVEKASLSKYAPTGSMLPTFGDSANGIRIIPESYEQINIGDIISFEKNGNLIVHRVIDKGEDSNGRYFITKGDNNEQVDGKVYYEQVRYITIGVIY